MIDQWKLLVEAPLGEVGLVWAPSIPDRNDLIGTVFAYADGGRSVSSSSARGVDFTHWHPLPAPPGQKADAAHPNEKMILAAARLWLGDSIEAAPSDWRERLLATWTAMNGAA